MNNSEARKNLAMALLLIKAVAFSAAWSITLGNAVLPIAVTVAIVLSGAMAAKAELTGPQP